MEISNNPEIANNENSVKKLSAPRVKAPLSEARKKQMADARAKALATKRVIEAKKKEAIENVYMELARNKLQNQNQNQNVIPETKTEEIQEVQEVSDDDTAFNYLEAVCKKENKKKYKEEKIDLLNKINENLLKLQNTNVQTPNIPVKTFTPEPDYEMIEVQKRHNEKNKLFDLYFNR